jgi:hypothetical protein
MEDVRGRMRDGMQEDAGYTMQDAGYRMQDAGCRM